MSFTKGQHFIPKMLLKRFSDNLNKIHMLDRTENKIILSSIHSVAKKTYLYSIDLPEGKNDAVEKFLSKIESDTEPLLKKLIDNNEVCTESDLLSLITFVVPMMLRNPSLVDIASEQGGSENMKRLLEKTATEKGFSLDTAREYFADMKIPGYAYSQTLPHLIKKRTRDLVENFDIEMHKSSSVQEKYIISDNYVSFDFLYDWRKNTDFLDIWSKAISKVYCPLSSHHLLLFSKKENKNVQGTSQISFREKKASDNFIQQANFFCYRHSDRFLFANNKKDIRPFLFT